MRNRIITDKLICAFARLLEMDEKSAATREKYLRDISAYRRWLNGIRINKETCLRYKQYLLDNYRRTSANSMIAALNAFFRFAGWPELCLRQVKIQKKVYCSEEKELTKEEYRRLVAAARSWGDRRMELLIQTICATGIRVSEQSPQAFMLILRRKTISKKHDKQALSRPDSKGLACRVDVKKFKGKI